MSSNDYSILIELLQSRHGRHHDAHRQGMERWNWGTSFHQRPVGRIIFLLRVGSTDWMVNVLGKMWV